MSDSSVETELKLYLTEEAIAALPQAVLLRDLPRRVVRLDAVYFDTADRVLQANGMALRLRRAGRQWTQTLKAEPAPPVGDNSGVTAASAAGGLSARSEWEWPLTLRSREPRIDRSRLQATPAGALLRAQPRSGPLRAVFRVRVRRTLWNVSFGRSRIEVALDEGRIDARPGGRPASVPVTELELELKEGRADDLVTLALALAGAGRGALPLIPAPRSKAERGYRLAADELAPVAKATARGFVAALRPDLSAATALRAIVAHGLHVLLANAEGLRDAYGVEYVHQARVALRRVRSALRQLDREGHDFPAHLAAELQWIGRALGSARDGDVLVDHTLPLLTDTAPEGLRAACTSMLARARVRRDAARRRAVAALLTPRFARCALQLQAWSLTKAGRGGHGGRSLARLAPRVLGRAHQQMFDAAPFFTALPPERRHRVRILAKRLRYALDILSVTLPPAAVEPYATALAQLQDVLGDLNDAAVVMAELPRFTSSRALRDHARQWYDQHERPLLLDAEKRLLALLESARPWIRQKTKPATEAGSERQEEHDAGEQGRRSQMAAGPRARRRTPRPAQQR